MGEPVYAKEGPRFLAKLMAFSLAGIWVWNAFDPVTFRSVRQAMVVLIPLGLIWYPEAVCVYLNRGVSTVFVSRLGWFLLVTLMIFPLIRWLAWVDVS